MLAPGPPGPQVPKNAPFLRLCPLRWPGAASCTRSRWWRTPPTGSSGGPAGRSPRSPRAPGPPPWPPWPPGGAGGSASTRYRVRGYLGDSIKGHLHADNKNGQEFPYFYSTVQVNTFLKQPNPFTHTRRKNTKKYCSPLRGN